MKTKNLSLEDFQEKKISKNGLKSIFGGDPNNGPGIELIPTDDNPIGGGDEGPGGNGITTASIREDEYPFLKP